MRSLMSPTWKDVQCPAARTMMRTPVQPHHVWEQCFSTASVTGRVLTGSPASTKESEALD